jgi:hypothetical protein
MRLVHPSLIGLTDNERGQAMVAVGGIAIGGILVSLALTGLVGYGIYRLVRK